MRQMVYKKWDIYPFIESKKIKIEIEIDIATWIGIHQGDIDRVLVVAKQIQELMCIPPQMLQFVNSGYVCP